VLVFVCVFLFLHREYFLPGTLFSVGTVQNGTLKSFEFLSVEFLCLVNYQIVVCLLPSSLLTRFRQCVCGVAMT
jgi:hypothetical protein